jgi:hypothetical protein
MLYRFEVENFFSIRDRQVIDLTVDGKVPDGEGCFGPVFQGAEVRAPKVVAFFGANASGKTTVLRALIFLVTFIRDSVQNTTAGIRGCERFNDEESGSRPIRFAIEFGGAMNLTPQVQQRAIQGEPVEEGLYRYELELEVVEGSVRGIAVETLRQKPKGRGKWQRVFERDAAGQVRDSRAFSLSGYQHLVKTLAGNHTVISSFAKFQHPAAQLFDQMARRVYFQIEPIHAGADGGVIDFLKTRPDMIAKINGELARIDVGVEGMRFQDSLNGPILLFKHQGLQFEMPWILESHGTRAFIRMFPLLDAALEGGGLVVIDEMDAAIHPLVLPELIRWFRDAHGRNRLGSQLWLSCHSASLLDDLTKEEIVICEKDRQGRTSVHSLMDVKVRRDDNHYRKYLSGIYGGVPSIG